MTITRVLPLLGLIVCLCTTCRNNAVQGGESLPPEVFADSLIHLGQSVSYLEDIGYIRWSESGGGYYRDLPNNKVFYQVGINLGISGPLVKIIHLYGQFHALQANADSLVFSVIRILDSAYSYWGVTDVAYEDYGDTTFLPMLVWKSPKGALVSLAYTPYRTSATAFCSLNMDGRPIEDWVPPAQSSHWRRDSSGAVVAIDGL